MNYRTIRTEEVELTYNWNEDRRRLGEKVMTLAQNDWAKAIDVIGKINAEGNYETALKAQVIEDLNVQVKSRKTTETRKPSPETNSFPNDEDLQNIFKSIFGDCFK